MIKYEKELIRRIQKGKGESREEFNRYCTPIIAKFMQSKYDDKVKPIPSRIVDLGDMIENPEDLIQSILNGAYKYLKKNGLEKSLGQYLQKPTVYAVYRFSMKTAKRTITSNENVNLDTMPVKYSGSRRVKSKDKYSEVDPLWFKEYTQIKDIEQSTIEEETKRELKEYLTMNLSFLKKCIKRLSKTQLTVAWLCIEHKSVKAVAQQRGVSSSAIVQVRDLAFKKLRECISELRRIHETA